MNFSYNKKKYNLFQEKIEIFSLTSYFFMIISKCYNKPNLKNLVKHEDLFLITNRAALKMRSTRLEFRSLRLSPFALEGFVIKNKSTM